MQIWRTFGEVPTDLGRTVVTVGNFDGVHQGHVRVVNRACELSRELEAPRVVVATFDPHPMAVLRPEHAPVALSTIEERAALLGAAGADDVLVIPFSREIAGWSPDQFVTRVLVGTLHAAAVVVGANFRFGAKAAGDVHTLEQLGREHGFIVSGVELDGGPQVWSSTYVRQSLASGDVAGAAEALGRPVSVSGPVVRGEQRGRQLGYPTANVAVGGPAVPADGVYAGWLTRLDTGERHPAAISVGTNPTFDGHRDPRVEAYALDRNDLELYDVDVQVTFVARLRGMERFDGAQALVEAMDEDVRRTREILGA